MFGAELVEGFLAAADSWVCDSYAVDTRFIAFKTPAGCELIEASLALWPLPHASDNSFTIETSNLLAGQQQVFPVSKHEALEALRAASRGQLAVSGNTLALAALDDLDFHSEMTHRDRWFCPLHLKVSANRASAPQPPSVAAMDADLRLRETPFDGITDLAAWLGLGADFSGGRAPSLTITVAPPVDLVYEQTSLSGNSLTATLHAHPTLDTSRITFGVRAAPGRGLAGRRQVAHHIAWSEPRDNRKVGTLTVELADADSVLTLLSLGTETIRRQWILDRQRARNVRFVSLNQFDADLKKVRQALFDATDGRRFEQGIAVLLHLLGFAAAQPLETDSPDLVVATPAGQTVIVECTTRLADFGAKSGQLVERRAALSKSLSEMNLPSVVTAALVCRLRRDEIGVTDQDLRDRRILLFTAEDIESAIERSRFLLDPDALLQQAITSKGLPR